MLVGSGKWEVIVFLPLPTPSAHPVPRKRIRVPWTPAIITLLVVLSSGLSVEPIRDAVTGSDVAEAYLSRPISYVALAPLSNMLDALTLLSVSQAIAFVLGVFVLFGAWRLRVARRGDVTPLRHLIATAVVLALVGLTFVLALALPRPMAALMADNANIIIVDFHSHTSASHDGRSGWSVEDNRAWHRDAGYNAAFINDHGVVSAAEQGIANNPNPAGTGVSVLQSIEVSWAGEHVGIPGIERSYKGLLTNNGRDVDEQALRLASFITGREPVVIWHHPKELNRLPVLNDSTPAGVRAIEIVGGSPSRIQGVRDKRDQLIAIASSRNIPVTSGSDNHGWGRATPGWTIMNLPAWRGMNSDELAMIIERVLRESGTRGTRVIERRVANPGQDKLQLGLSVVAVPLRMLTTISNEERAAWLLWTWALWSGFQWWRRRRHAAPA
jgi:predicted metal-dependent phosphoesterase TrpH